jgi:hypothetical protein
MQLEQATELAMRISQLWQRTTPEQVDVIIEALRGDSFESLQVEKIIADLYVEDSSFFELSTLRQRVKAISRPKGASFAADIARRYRTVDAQQIVRAQPELDGQLEAELLFRKCRSQFKRRIHLCTEVSRLQQRELKPHEIRRVESYREMSERKCRTDLFAAGLSIKQAEVIAAYVVGTDGDCQGAIDQIRAAFDPDSQTSSQSSFEGASS